MRGPLPVLLSRPGCERAAASLCSLLQNDVLNRHLALTLTDEFVRILFPEVVEQRGGGAGASDRGDAHPTGEADYTCTNADTAALPLLHAHGPCSVESLGVSAKSVAGVDGSAGRSAGAAAAFGTCLAATRALGSGTGCNAAAAGGVSRPEGGGTGMLRTRSMSPMHSRGHQMRGNGTRDSGGDGGSEERERALEAALETAMDQVESLTEQVARLTASCQSSGCLVPV
jgi:hypothetical protein